MSQHFKGWLEHYAGFTRTIIVSYKAYFTLDADVNKQMGHFGETTILEQKIVKSTKM